jgi:hypothetical protein
MAPRQNLGEDITRVVSSTAALLSTNPFALKHTLAAANILHGIIQQGPSAASMPQIKAAIGSLGDEDLLNEVDEVAKSLEAKEYFVDAVQRFGKPCANPGSFMGATLAVVSSTGFVEGIRKNIKGGGCNCSRANLAGACLGYTFYCSRLFTYLYIYFINYLRNYFLFIYTIIVIYL